MAGVVIDNGFTADIDVDCLIIGGGAAGLTAALAAKERGLDVLVAEREDRLSGSTALSSGLIPAAQTNAQNRQHFDDDHDVFIADIMAKNKHKADADHVRRCVENVSKTIDWLEENHEIPFHVLDGFLYPGHTRYRMHAVPEVTGVALINRLEEAAIKHDILISCNLKVTDLDLSSANIGDGEVAALAGFGHFPALRSLILADNSITADGVAELATSPEFPALRTLYLFGNPVGNEARTLLGE